MWPGGRGGRAEFIQGCMGMVASCSLSEMACGEMEMVIAWSLITRVGEIRAEGEILRFAIWVWGLRKRFGRRAPAVGVGRDYVCVDICK